MCEGCREVNEAIEKGRATRTIELDDEIVEKVDELLKEKNISLNDLMNAFLRVILFDDLKEMPIVREYIFAIALARPSLTKEAMEGAVETTEEENSGDNSSSTD